MDLSRTVACKATDIETSIPFSCSIEVNPIKSRTRKWTESLLLPWVNQLLNLLDLTPVSQSPSVLVQSPIIMMEFLLLLLLRLLLLSLFSSLLPCCEPLFSCPILLFSCSMRHHAAIHGQSLRSALPGGGEGTVDGAGCELSNFIGTI